MANLGLLKTLARDRKLQLKQLAELAGLSEQGIHKILRQNSTTIETLEKLSAILEVSPRVFFEDTPAAPSATGDAAVAVAGNNNIAGNNVNVGEAGNLHERITLLERLIEEKDQRLEEKERTIRILLEQKK